MSHTRPHTWAGYTSSASGGKCHYGISWHCTKLASVHQDRPLSKRPKQISPYGIRMPMVRTYNVSLNKDFELESLKELCKRLAKRYLRSHCQSLFVRPSSSSPALRRPRRVLLNPDDPTTAANAQYIGSIQIWVSRHSPAAVRADEVNPISRQVCVRRVFPCDRPSFTSIHQS